MVGTNSDFTDYTVSRILNPVWEVLLADEFEPEFFALPQQVQDVTLAMTPLLQHKQARNWEGHTPMR